MPESQSHSGAMQKKPKESWENEKNRYLSMPRSERRKEYMTRFYVEYTESTFPRAGSNTPGSEKTPLDKICVWQGDITSLEFDAIVNAANEQMRGGGGVDGAIHKAAGKSLLEECIARYSSGCAPGEARLTGGYKLPAKYVIHTVGPRGENPVVLANCYDSVLQIVKNENLKTVAFPCISTGIFGYPNEKACHVALKTVLHWLQSNPDWDGRIVFCVFLDKDKHLYDKNVKKIFADPESSAVTKEGLLNQITHFFTSSLKDLPAYQLIVASSDPALKTTLNVDNSKVSPSDQTTKDTHSPTSPVEDNSLSKEPSTPDDSELKVPCEKGTKEGEAISADVEPQSNEALEPPDSGEDGEGEIVPASPHFTLMSVGMGRPHLLCIVIAP
ncbi:hypothetical protein EB796_004955 [Bugula neritina]|uniref:Macro domain-containing protein n=1 Tax=Bugula neritina TaxID=10212 RepID=A0A7J7KET3_BUGNE|nr:hypothetical protein EB796_004955 [Bugula neritina]